MSAARRRSSSPADALVPPLAGSRVRVRPLVPGFRARGRWARPDDEIDLPADNAELAIRSRIAEPVRGYRDGQ